MTIAICLADVEAVLIAGRWYRVLDGSLGLDSYEYVQSSDRGGDPLLLLRSGEEDHLSPTGFYFKTEDAEREVTAEGNVETVWVYGPLTTIQALRTGRECDTRHQAP